MSKSAEEIEKIGKLIYPGESNVYARPCKNGSWLFEFTNDYPLQHGKGSSCVIPQTVVDILCSYASQPEGREEGREEWTIDRKALYEIVSTAQVYALKEEDSKIGEEVMPLIISRLPLPPSKEQPAGVEEIEKALAFMKWAKDSDLFYEFGMVFNKNK